MERRSSQRSPGHIADAGAADGEVMEVGAGEDVGEQSWLRKGRVAAAEPPFGRCHVSVAA